MGKVLLLFLSVFFLTPQVLAQYSARGTSLNDGYLPNLDEPDKWMVAVDGMFDWQREKTSTGQQSFQTTHANANIFYGGQIFRGGFQLVHDSTRNFKDISLGFAFAYNRPLFIEVGAGYLSRVANNASTEGWSYNAKIGYYYNWIMHVKYRVRIRLALMFNYKTINDFGDPNITNVYPLIGFEFET